MPINVSTLCFRLYSTQDGSLKLVSTSRGNGSDALGHFEAITDTYSAGGVPITTTTRGYVAASGLIQILSQVSRSATQHSLLFGKT